MQNSTSKFHNFSFQSSKLAFYHFSLLSFNPPQCSHLLTFHLLLSLTCPKTMSFWPKFRIGYFTTEASLVRIDDGLQLLYMKTKILLCQYTSTTLVRSGLFHIWVMTLFTTSIIYVVHMSWKWVFNSN